MAPLVFQCGSCFRVLSDSNQLVAAVAELDVLVLDAIVNVSFGEPADEGAFIPLMCSSCSCSIGRLYCKAPTRGSTAVVHTPSAPRYSLQTSMLESYVLGSVKQQHENAGGAGHAGRTTTQVSCSMLPVTVTNDALPHVKSRLASLEGAEADVREQLAQMMRVVLGLDSRLRAVEPGRRSTEPGLAAQPTAAAGRLGGRKRSNR
jgi:hypothetical protein